MKTTVPWMCSCALPALQAAAEAVFGDAAEHLQGPVDRRDEIDFDHAAEVFHRIERGLAGRLVDLGGQRVAGDPGRRNEDPHRAPLGRDLVEDLAAKGLVGHVADAGHGLDPIVGELVDRTGQLRGAGVLVDQPDGLHPAPHQFQRHGLADPASGPD